MKKRHLRTGMKVSEFDSSPMADLAFLLLIFFIVTSSFLLKQGIFMSLPSTKGGISVPASRLLKIKPLVQNYEVEGMVLTDQELKAQMQQKLKQNPDFIAVIFMPRKLKYQRLMDTLSIAKEVGVKKISIQDLKP
ncbi:MAG: biopolymer transporter ExbD [Candidatus Hydrogenedentota bacterium]|nr:MAG: biopolymer transporter ExbD [Candidatus Hydrogenedentota bacterium]